MMIKIFGAILVIGACGGMGYKLASNYLKEERNLRTLIRILDYMQCELHYRLSPLPMLCQQVADECRGGISEVFKRFAILLEEQFSPDVEGCMHTALSSVKDIPPLAREMLEQLGRSLGRFDVDGQIRELDTVRQECRRNLDSLLQNKNERLRSYKTLGLCAGAALAILFL